MPGSFDVTDKVSGLVPPSTGNSAIAHRAERGRASMRLPRDWGGETLAKLLKRYGYEITRQTSSHIRLTTQQGDEQHEKT